MENRRHCTHTQNTDFELDDSINIQNRTSPSQSKHICSTCVQYQLAIVSDTNKNH